MSKNPTRTASFFKIMIGSFTRALVTIIITSIWISNFIWSFFGYLFNYMFTFPISMQPLPSVFTQKYGHMLPENVELRISSGKKWNMKLEEMEDDKYCFGYGWSKFAKDVDLKFGEFLVFRFVGQSMFNVAVYTKHGCERKFPANSVSNEQSEERSPLRFEICLKGYHSSRMPLPKDFWSSAGLMGKESVKLVYLPNKCFQDVVLDRRNNGSRIHMACGWSQFRKENEIQIGKTYSFEFKPSRNVIQVKEIENRG